MPGSYVSNSGQLDQEVRTFMKKASAHIKNFRQLENAAIALDGDGGESRDSEVQRAISGANGSFTHRVHRFEENLEIELGVTPLSRSESRRKPQYIHYKLESNAIEQGRFEAFSGLVTTLNSPPLRGEF